MGLGPGQPVGEGEGDRRGNFVTVTHHALPGAALPLCGEKPGLREVTESPGRAEPAKVESTGLLSQRSSHRCITLHFLPETAGVCV